jgi:ferrochelatase
MKRQAVILVNVGTPDSLEVRDVRKYLRAFLSDPRVIDIPWLIRLILVNLIIVPFRSPKSARLYRLLWTDKGSPLLIHLNNLVEKLEANAPEGTRYFGAMRYGNPSLKAALELVKKKKYGKLIILPLFPHYASSTGGSISEYVLKNVSAWDSIPTLQIISGFYNHPEFINVLAQHINAHQPDAFDHLLFSYHGLPNRQVNKVHPGHSCTNCSCEHSVPEYGRLCYKAACYETTRLLTAALNLPPAKYSTGFQSRLTKNWLEPFTDEILMNLARSGCKRVLVIAPSFVADCLETSVELGIEYRDLFIREGGEELVLAQSLNDLPEWVAAVKKIHASND